MKKVFAVLVFVALCLTALTPLNLAFAQGKNSPPPQAQEERAEFSRAVHHDTSSVPLREMFERGERPGPARGGRDFEPGRPEPVGKANPPGIDPLAERGVGAPSAFANPKAATEGTAVDPNARVAPPDTTGDVGPNHYVQWVNLRYSIYTLTRDVITNEITGFTPVPGFPKQGNVVWQGFGGRCQTDNDGDPIVQYDQMADRWILTQFAVSGTPYTQCVAVSTTGDPTGTYHRYAFSYSRDFPDYPKLGVWPDAYYITYNMFKSGRSFSGGQVCAFERDKMLIGATARQACVRTTSAHSFQPADLEGSILPPAGSRNFLLSITTTGLNFWRFAVNWGTGSGTLTGPTAIAGVSFSRACGGGACIPQPGTTQQLDSLGDRLMYRLSYRNLGVREALVINHSVATGGVSAIRWYELTNAIGQTINSATPVVRQQGTFSPSADHRWMGSAAIDKTGGIAVGYNISSSTIKPSIRYAYRGPLDPLGTLGNETEAKAGPGVQTPSLSRWGDYSTISVDPVDGCTMVFTSQYQPANGNYNWTTYIYSFKLSTCP